MNVNAISFSFFKKSENSKYGMGRRKKALFPRIVKSDRPTDLIPFMNLSLSKAGAIQGGGAVGGEGGVGFQVFFPGGAGSKGSHWRRRRVMEIRYMAPSPPLFSLFNCPGAK